MRTQNQILRAFTLVELMIVISIIAVLVALLFPAIKIAMLKAETGNAKGTIMSIASAFKALDREYSGWPNITEREFCVEKFIPLCICDLLE